MNLQTTINNAIQVLKRNNISSSNLDAEIIIADIMGCKREHLITKNEINVSQEVISEYKRAIARRVSCEPVAYIIGKKEFWSEDFIVKEGTLVPRPETELLIYKIVSFFKNKKINILDIGTGTGCILLSILKELGTSRGTGIDISSNAIRNARINSKKFKLLNRSKFKVCDLNKFYGDKYDLIVSNPPYIPTKDIKDLSKDIVNYEPKAALDGGRDGLDLIKKVIYKSNYLLKVNGILALEIGRKQYKRVSKILSYHGFRELGKEYDCKNNVRCIITTKVKF